MGHRGRWLRVNTRGRNDQAKTARTSRDVLDAGSAPSRPSPGITAGIVANSSQAKNDLTELLNGTVRNQFFRVWVSHADDLSKSCCTTTTGRAKPLRAGRLKRVWVLVEE